MEQDIRNIHERVYEFLLNRRKSDEFNFTFRKSNRANRLDQGYWFYGNEYYLGLSFWTGMDWKNRTPNVFFTIHQTGRTFLEISVTDSENKREFVSNHILGKDNTLGLEGGNARYRKVYTQFDDNYLRSLDYFLKHDKLIIDKMIYDGDIDPSQKERIGFISDSEFEQSLAKINAYRHQESSYHRPEPDQELMGFQIGNFGPIIDTNFIRLNQDATWIFLTGENGTGKTSLLKAIAGGICRLKMEEATDSFFKFEFTNSVYTRQGNEQTSIRKPLLNGFCVYGASRLKNSRSNPRNFSIPKALNKNGITSSLFNHDTVLIDIQDQLSVWQRDEEMRGKVERRQEYIREILVDILPNIVDVRFARLDNYTITEYIEQDVDGKEFPPVDFNKLASGMKSLVAMIGDMMMRLYNQQPHIDDASELTGLVIIDEIDIHLHPNLQKYLVEQLTNTFPRVRFIVSTHSPMPLLGAPPNAQFFRIERNSAYGVELADLTEIDVPNMLPNAILSSELFGMDKLFEREYSSSSTIRTENTIQEMQVNDEVEESLRIIANRLRQRDEES